VRSLAALTLLGLTWLALQGALGYQLGREHAGREAERIEKEHERHRADSLQARADTLYRAVRVYIVASDSITTRLVLAEGKLDQCQAYQF